MFFFSLITAIFGVVSISSCTKDDSSSNVNAKIVGTWDLHHADVTAFGTTTTLSASEIYTIGKTMMGTDNVKFLDATLVITETTINGESFTLSGNRLTMIGGVDFSDFKITFENISSSSLTLRYDFNGVVEDMVYKKK